MGEFESYLLRGIGAFWQKIKRRPLPKVASTESGKLNFLESIRGLAACAVVFSHILATYYPKAGTGEASTSVITDTITKLFYGLPLGFMASGHFAVVLFFTLSGFVLTYKFFQTRNDKDLQKQAAKRHLRLAIPIFCIVAVAYLLMANGAMSNTPKVAEITGSAEAARIFNFTPTMYQAFYDATMGVLVDGKNQYNPVLWTMTVEFIGSFIVFGFALLVGKLKMRWLFYLAAAITLGQTYYLCFILGMVLADLANTTNFITYMREKVSKVYVYGLLAIVAVLASFPSPTTDISHTIYQTLLIPGLDPNYVFHLWHYIAAPILMVVVLVRPELQRILNTRFLVFIGGISFAVYLTHYLILHSLGDSLFVWLHNYGFHKAALVASLATIIVTLLASIFWKKYIDDMSVRVSRKFAQFILR